MGSHDCADNGQVVGGGFEDDDLEVGEGMLLTAVLGAGSFWFDHIWSLLFRNVDMLWNCIHCSRVRAVSRR